MAQLQLQFDGVRDQASVAGIQVTGPRARSFLIPSFLQNDTDDSAASLGARTRSRHQKENERQYLSNQTRLVLTL